MAHGGEPDAQSGGSPCTVEIARSLLKRREDYRELGAHHFERIDVNPLILGRAAARKATSMRGLPERRRVGFYPEDNDCIAIRRWPE